MSDEESRRAKEDASLSDRGLSSSSHVVGMEVSISPMDGRRIPVFGSTVAALDSWGADRARKGAVMNALETVLTNLRRLCTSDIVVSRGGVCSFSLVWLNAREGGGLLGVLLE